MSEAATGFITLRAMHVQRAIERLRTDIDLATACANKLIADGFLPTHIDAGDTPKPIVWIETKPSCEKLKTKHGTHYYRTDGMPGCRIETWRAEILGCHVQWFEVKSKGVH